jgi:hypothetical protein
MLNGVSIVFSSNNSLAFEQRTTLTYANSIYSYSEYFKANTHVRFKFSSVSPVTVLITDSTHIFNPVFSYLLRQNIRELDYLLETPYGDSYLMIITGDIESHTSTVNDPPVKVRVICKNQSMVVKQDITVELTVSNRTFNSNSYSLFTNEKFYFIYSSETTKGIEEASIHQLYSFTTYNTERNITSGSCTVTSSGYDSYHCEITGNVHSHSSTTYDPDIPIYVKVNTEIDPTPWISLIIICIIASIVILFIRKRISQDSTIIPKKTENSPKPYQIIEVEPVNEKFQKKVQTEPVCVYCKVPLMVIDKKLSVCPECNEKYRTRDICGKCGKEIPPMTRFCPGCGARSQNQY